MDAWESISLSDDPVHGHSGNFCHPCQCEHMCTCPCHVHGHLFCRLDCIFFLSYAAATATAATATMLLTSLPSLHPQLLPPPVPRLPPPLCNCHGLRTRALSGRREGSGAACTTAAAVIDSGCGVWLHGWTDTTSASNGPQLCRP